MLHDIYPHFAIFQDTQGRGGANIPLYEKRYKLVSPYGCELPTNDDYFRLCRIDDLRINDNDDIPEIKKVITAENQEVYTWDTKYSILHPRLKTWIPVLDFNIPCYAGQFLYTWRRELTSSYTEHAEYQKNMRNMMIHIIKDMESISRPPVQIPKFVTDILKANAMTKKESCGISLTPFSECSELRITNCYHIFEGANIQTWLKKSNKCPVCKEPITNTFVI